MKAHEIDRALGYTPCVCGVIDGTWHPECYDGKSDSDLSIGLAKARRKARVMLETQAAMIVAAQLATPNARLTAPNTAQRSNDECDDAARRGGSGCTDS